MIVFVLTPGHSYTHRSTIGIDPALKVEFLYYTDMAKLRSMPRATYIFTDMDRLPTEVLRVAGRLYRQLRDQGIRVLNDPARVLGRGGLLRRLFAEGINSFNAYRAEEGASPARWPVFLRTDGDHIAPMPELYENPAALEQGIANSVTRGVPLSRLLIVEFAADEMQPGLYQKFSTFRVGPSRFAHTCVIDTHWIAKGGRVGLATPEMFEEEYRIVRDDPYGPAVERAFDIAGVDYGRVDFGLSGGKVQIYEINTNPDVKLDMEHHSPVRMETLRLFRENYLNAMRAIDTPPDATPNPMPG